jgi:hypothetical protein
MIRLYVDERTRGSLQNEKDLRAVRAALGVSDKTITDSQIAELAPFLTARNQVAHDLDINLRYSGLMGPGARSGL